MAHNLGGGNAPNAGPWPPNRVLEAPPHPHPKARVWVLAQAGTDNFPLKMAILGSPLPLRLEVGVLGRGVVKLDLAPSRGGGLQG